MSDDLQDLYYGNATSDEEHAKVQEQAAKDEEQVRRTYLSNGAPKG